MAEDKFCRFLDLPLEVRNLIYRLWVVSPTPIHPYFPDRNPGGYSNAINTAILAANPQINQESTAVLEFKNIGVICNKRHLWFLRRCFRPPPPERGPNAQDLNTQDGPFGELDSIARDYMSRPVVSDLERESLLRIRSFEEDKFWNMISRLHHVRIKVDWIDARPIGTYVLHRAVWLCCELILIFMLQPFHDLVMRGAVNMLDTVVISLV